MPSPALITDRLPPSNSPEAGALVRLLNAVFRHSRALFVGALLGIAVPSMWILLHPRTYTSSGAFVPQESGPGRSQISGLAAQLGLAGMLGSGEDLPGYYPELVRSRGILRIVADTDVTYRWNGRAETVPLWSRLHPNGNDSAQQVEAAIDILAKRITVSRDKDSGIIRFSVTYPDSVLSAIIARRILRVLENFNVHTRQSQASAERIFVQSRLAAARAGLRTAEDALQLFLQTNRAYRNSPALLFEQDRLQREVTDRQNMVTSLTQAYEQARIQEVRNTPIFTVLEEPQIPVRADPRGLVPAIAIGLVVGILAGAVLAIFAEFVRRVRLLDPAAFAELSEHLHLAGRTQRGVRRSDAPSTSSGAPF